MRQFARREYVIVDKGPAAKRCVAAVGMSAASIDKMAGQLPYELPGDL